MFTLADVQQRAREHPQSFYAPSLAECKRVRVGDAVQLVFEYPDDDAAEDSGSWGGGERMWVRVTYRNRAKLAGRLRNIPLSSMELKYNHLVQFTFENICNIRPVGQDDEDDEEGGGGGETEATTTSESKSPVVPLCKRCNQRHL